jgi:nitroreductase
VHPVKNFVKTVREVVSIPRTVTPLCIVYVGYPTDEKPSRTQYDAERVHWQEYKKH